MKPQNLKKGDKANHQQRGLCVLLTNLNTGPNKGTMVKIVGNGEEFEASTVYLREVKNESGTVPANTGTKAGG